MTGIEVIGIVLGSTVLTELIRSGYGILKTKIDRKYKKEDENDSVANQLRDIQAKLEAVDKKIDENEAKAARARILMMADDIRLDLKHSKDRFDSILQDIETYNSFCSETPGFLNGVTAASQDIIKDCYKRRIERNDFL